LDPFPGVRYDLREVEVVDDTCPEGSPWEHDEGVAGAILWTRTSDTSVEMFNAEDSGWSPSLLPAAPPLTWKVSLQADGWPPYDWPTEDWASTGVQRSDEDPQAYAYTRKAMVVTEAEASLTLELVWEIYNCGHWSYCKPWGEAPCGKTVRYHLDFAEEIPDYYTYVPPWEE
jgi:hypothetical protein